ncbi:hypothetical protein, unlikely [Trypanosoma brucei gambiense DAL972]|uniref:Uncharacterized protein n=1 Tax=Trypanosoma brucei gambiense (strain MHOM/CI/86/DAL972) TaxID=679716 RepID=C9ZT90_TRYB9|nr:hypothetical protein, unlikely [Trypanosoma brucei gambiense DAL972]CBH12625.1 hypothetical protein, unlikely [Trypanosoma brucei gambiense DAL972]|eukprot:XP_011774905.1 hypothetical protein, unlikely [Trypanosoma brucei gambiense DAL972]
MWHRGNENVWCKLYTRRVVTSRQATALDTMFCKVYSLLFKRELGFPLTSLFSLLISPPCRHWCERVGRTLISVLIYRTVRFWLSSPLEPLGNEGFFFKKK